MKLCAVVVTYYPDVEDTVKNIRQYAPYVERLILWENTPREDVDRYKLSLSEFADKIVCMGTGKNEGIGYALNRAVEYAEEMECTHLLTMDQDSTFPSSEKFLKYKHAAFDLSVRYADCIVGPNINNTFDATEEFREVDQTITSGSIYPVRMLRRIGLFRDDYFIDGVDFEISFRALKNGAKIFVATNIPLIHRLGNPTVTRLGFKVDNYSAFRLYHIARNSIWLSREYPEYDKSYLKGFWMKFVVWGIPKIIIGEQDKWNKIVHLLKGLKDGYIRHD